MPLLQRIALTLRTGRLSGAGCPRVGVLSKVPTTSDVSRWGQRDSLPPIDRHRTVGPAEIWEAKPLR